MKNIIESMRFTKKEFKEVMEVISATSKDQVRPILQGVNFNSDEVAALDGYRLSIRKNKNTLIGSYTIHKDEIKIIIGKINSVKDEIITINFLENNTAEILLDNEIIYSCDVMTGQYIKYKQLIPTIFNGYIEADTREIKESIKPLKKNTHVLFNIDEEKFTIKDICSETNKNNYRDKKIFIGYTVNKLIKAKKKGDDIEILFNHTYIKEALKNYSNREKITIKFINHISPAVITDNANKFDLVLPIRKVWHDCEINVA